jgi:hypothetical protein
MLDFDHYTKLKKASIVPEHIRKMFEDDGELGKVLIEMCVPTIRVAMYAATHEPQLFSDLLEKMKNAKKLAPYFHHRLGDEELYRSLSLLGDECLKCLLSELDCSESVFNGLRNSVIHSNPDAFERVLQGWDGCFSLVTPICKLLYLEVYFNDYFDWIIKEANRIDEITDMNQQNQEGEAFVKNSSGVITSMLKDVFNDKSDDELNNRLEKTFDDYLDDTLKLAAEALKHDEVLSINYKEEFLKGVLAVDPNVEIADIEQIPESIFYKVLLIAYHFLATETSISQPAKGVIREILFAPEYETIWKQYEDSNSVDFLLEEFEPIVGIQQMPQIEEPTIEEPQPEQLSAADYNQVIPDALTTEHLDLIKEFEIGKRYFARKKRDYVQPHCMLLNEGFNVMDDEDKANRFERLMKLLARTRCIYPSILVMRSCAYAMTGYGFYNPFKPVPVFWNREKVDILLYICQKFYNKRGNTKTPISKFKNPAEVFHVIKEYQEASNHSQSASKVDTSDFGKDFKAIFPEL